MKSYFICIGVLVCFCGLAFGGGDEIPKQKSPVENSIDLFAIPPSSSVHKEQMEALEGKEKIISGDQLEALKLEKEGKLFPGKDGLIKRKAQQPTIDKDFIVFGYMQK